jgi:NADPH:quinone reductase-like Zn-dependent oxidoreductase
LTDEQAAAVPEAFLTAYDALLVRGRLSPGERVLVHAAGSGVGTAGIQIARALGCQVIGTSRTAEKLERCRALGMHAGIVPQGGAFAAQVLGVTAGRGADVVLDLVGGSYLRETLSACALGARVVLVGLTAGSEATIALGELLRKRLQLVGTVMRSRPLEEKIEVARLLERNLSGWLSEGVVRPVVDRVLPLSSASEAHEYLAQNTSFGKVVLRVTGAMGAS